MRSSDWSLDVCSSDLIGAVNHQQLVAGLQYRQQCAGDRRDAGRIEHCPLRSGLHLRQRVGERPDRRCSPPPVEKTLMGIAHSRSEEHTSELQSLMRISYAVFCLKKKQTQTKTHNLIQSTSD